MKRKLTALLLALLLLISLLPVSGAAVGGASRLIGVWEGTYDGYDAGTVFQRKLRLNISFAHENWFRGIALVDGGDSVGYVFSGDLYPDGTVRFIGTNWVVNLNGFNFAEFRATLDADARSMVGSVNGDASRMLNLKKISDDCPWKNSNVWIIPADWKGEYVALQEGVEVARNMELHIDSLQYNNRHFHGTVDISENGVFFCSYAADGIIDPDLGVIELQGYEWIQAPLLVGDFAYFCGWLDFSGTPTIRGYNDFGPWLMIPVGSEVAPIEGLPQETPAPEATEPPKSDSGEGKEKNEEGKPGGKAEGSKDGNSDRDTHCKNPSDHDTYCVDPCDLTNCQSGFTLGRDNNAFFHTNQPVDGAGFAGCTDYHLDDAYFRRLTEHSGAGEKNKVRHDMLRPWQGACYGVSLTMGVGYIGYNMPQFLWSGLVGDSYYTLPKPSERSEFLNLVNFLQLSQSLRGSGKRTMCVADCRNSALITEGVRDGLYDDLPAFLEKVICVCSPGKVGFLSYFTQAGSHTVLVTGSRFDEAEGAYHVELYDLNSVRPEAPEGQFIDMTVSGDCTAFWFTDANGGVVDSNNYRALLLEGPDEMAMLCLEFDNRYYYPMTRVSFGADETFRLSDAAGRVLEYDGVSFQGNLPIKGFSTVDYGDGSRISIVIDETDLLKLTSIGSTLDFDAYNDDDYMAISGTGIESAELHLNGGGLTFRGADCAFEAWVSTDLVKEDDRGLVSLRGCADGEVTITPAGDSAYVRCDECVTEAEAASFPDGGTECVKTNCAAPLAAFTVGADAVITPETVRGFTDVGPETDYAEAVRWAAEQGITTGTTTTTFSPHDTVTRGQAVTFLWRAMGCPEPSNSAAAAMFTDLTEGYYQKAVAWAVENGITKGIDDTRFDPASTLSTAHIVTFLYRTVNPGVDGWYAEAGDWARNGGLLEDLELPVDNASDCPRYAVVMLLWRLLG